MIERSDFGTAWVTRAVDEDQDGMLTVRTEEDGVPFVICFIHYGPFQHERLITWRAGKDYAPSQDVLAALAFAFGVANGSTSWSE